VGIVVGGMGVSVDGIGEAVAVAMAVAVEVLPGTGVSSSLNLPTCPHANVMTSEKNSIVHTKALCFFIFNSLHYFITEHFLYRGITITVKIQIMGGAHRFFQKYLSTFASIGQTLR
jgi:hypothetical protein